jgi:hypothetical protein
MSIPFEAYEGSEPYIFVSYAHKDKNAVYPEIKRLHDVGYRIWYDEGIPPTSEWPEEIAKAIEACAFFLVFISPQAVTSVNVRNKIYYALNEHKKVLAIYITKTDLPRGVKFRLGAI